MRGLKFSVATLITILLLAIAGFAQVRLSVPFTFVPGVTAYVDNGGVRDFRCGGQTYAGHCGTDFGVGLDTPVWAAADGYVSAINTGCPYGYYCSPCGGMAGNFVQMNASAGSNWSFLVAHLSQVEVSVGQYASCTSGPRLGLSGSSGCSTGPHTHFQVYHYGGCSADDPYWGDCSPQESFWVCQDYNQDISCTDCQ